jgi:hypothetical protein
VGPCRPSAQQQEQQDYNQYRTHLKNPSLLSQANSGRAPRFQICQPVRKRNATGRQPLALIPTHLRDANMNRLYLTMGAPLLMLGLIMATVTAGMAQEAISLPSINAVAGPDLPLNQIGYVPDILATARVTDPQGRVIGAVQKVEIQNGRAKRVEIALLGNPNPIMIDARDLRYDAEQNIVTTDQNVMQLQARAAI